MAVKKLTKDQKIARANRIERLLANKDLKQAFQDVRDAIYQAFEQAPADDPDTLVALKQRLHLLDSLRANLEVALRDGKFELARLLEEDKVVKIGGQRGRR